MTFGCAMSGNLCRCTGYVGIIDAIRGVIAGSKGPRHPGDSWSRPVSARARGLRSWSRCRHAGCRRSRGSRRRCSWRRGTRLLWARMFQPISRRRRRSTRALSSIIRSRRCGTFRECACGRRVLPGASITGDASAPALLTARCGVKVGPIAAEFHGSAEIDRDPAHRSGQFGAAGQDRREAVRRPRVSSAIDCWRRSSSRRGWSSASAID